MKIIRPEQPQKQAIIVNNAAKDNPETLKKNEPVQNFLKDDLIQEPKSIEDVMNSVLNIGTKNITFTITLTKRQYELWVKKGSERWLKRELAGLNRKRKKK